MKRAIVIDTETTGLTTEDDILQVSIIDYAGTVLFNEYIKPTRCKEWPEAEAIHGISSKMVENCKDFDYYKDKIQVILDFYDVIIGYNVNYDIQMLKSRGIDFSEFAEEDIYDIMPVFAEIYGEWNSYYRNYRWQKLTTCAQHYGYTWEEDAHNALGDVKATLYCFKKMRDKGEI